MYSRLLFLSILTVTLIVSQSSAQNLKATITGISTEPPQPLRVAPGQILYLQLRGITTRFDATQVATDVPPPRKFGGLSIRLQQANLGDREISSTLLPLLRGDYWDHCPPVYWIDPRNTSPLACGAPDSGEYLVRVQIPFELKPNAPLMGGPGVILPAAQDAVLNIQENGIDEETIRVIPVVDQIRVLRTCGFAPGTYSFPICSAEVFHADGHQVTADNPVRSNETVTAYALGLGIPDQPVASGVLAPASGIPITRPITVSYPGLSAPATRVKYAGLVGNNLSLYQMNFQVPEVPAGLPKCSSDVNSNLTVVFRGTASSDEISICAAP